VVSGSFRQAYVPAALLGRVLAGMQFVNYGTIPLGAVLGGAVAAIAGTRAAIGAMTVAYALSGLIIVFGPFRGRRDLPVWAESAEGVDGILGPPAAEHLGAPCPPTTRRSAGRRSPKWPRSPG
jgi:hypothetical protein